MVYERVTHFLLYPTSWRVSRGDLQEAEWPVLTLCNHNPLRVSQLFGGQSRRFPDNSEHVNMTWQGYLHENADLDSDKEFLNKAHTATDMIVSVTYRCSAGSVTCSDNVSMILTEQGLCRKLRPDRRASEVELVLNTEAYEYITDLSQTKGITVYVSEPHTTPVRGDTHFTVHPAHHFHVTLAKDTVHYLPPPYGNCTPGAPDHKACMSRCYVDKVRSDCYCRPFWFSDNVYGSPICSIQKHFTCVKDIMDSELKFCDCPVGCESSVYTLQMQSYPKLFHPLHDFIDSTSLQRVSHQYRQAQHIHSQIRQKNSTLVRAFLGVYQEAVTQTEQFEGELQQAMSVVKEEYVDLPARIHFHTNVGLKGIQTALEKGYLDPWTALQEGEIQRIQTSYQTVIATINRIVNSYRFKTAIDFNLAKLLFTPEDIQLSVSIDLASETLKNITSLYYALIDGKPLHIELTPDQRYDATLLPCQAITRNTDTVQRYFSGISNSFGLYMDDLSQLKVVLKGVLITKRYNETFYLRTKENYMKHSQDIIAATQLFKDQILGQCEKNMNNKVEAMYKLEQTLQVNVATYEDKLSSVLDITNTLKTNIFHVLDQFIPLTMDTNTSDSLLKYPLPQLGDDIDFKSIGYKIDALIFELRMSQHEVISSMKPLLEVITSVWDILFSEQFLQDFYIMLNNDVMEMITSPQLTAYFMDIFNSNKMLNRSPGNSTSLTWEQLLVLLNADIPLKEFHIKMDQVEDTFGNMLNASRMCEDVITSLRELQSILQKISLEFEKASLQEELGTTFGQENLLSLRVTKRSQNYLEWTQYHAYTVQSLLVEVGSLLVILLGASILTLLELCDICFSVAASKLCVHHKEPEDEKVLEKWDEIKIKDPKTASHSVDEFTSSLNLYRKSYVTFKDVNNLNGSEV